MTYHYAVYRSNLLLTRTLTRIKAERLARKYGPTCRVVEEIYSKGDK